MRKYVSNNTLINIIKNIKDKFAEKQHVHNISDISGLQSKLDALTPDSDITTSDELIAKVNQLSNIIDKLIPAIGDIYITLSTENPSVRFGGEWEKIEDKFLLASGNKYNVGDIGGEEDITLTTEQIPSHNHGFAYGVITKGTNGTNTISNSTKFGAYNAIVINNTEDSGGNSSHNNMPPYLVVYIWKRIA